MHTPLQGCTTQTGATPSITPELLCRALPFQIFPDRINVPYLFSPPSFSCKATELCHWPLHTYWSFPVCTRYTCLKSTPVTNMSLAGRPLSPSFWSVLRTQRHVCRIQMPLGLRLQSSNCAWPTSRQLGAFVGLITRQTHCTLGVTEGTQQEVHCVRREPVRGQSFQ